ncbi:MAG: hypothetical protein J6D52_06500 [Clostridia bacterium]|nr:hypothetical protein [Clostridia bacterium]
MNFIKEFSIKKIFLKKRFTIAFSVILAFFIWIIITVQQKPVISRTFSDLSVNINLENTFVSENNMNIIGDISKQRFTVVITGPTSLVSALTADQIGIYASAGEVDAPGKYSLKVSPTSTTVSAEYDITSISPPTVDVEFDYVDTTEFTITPVAVGVTAADGLVAENGIVGGTESDTVTITGPRTVVGKIKNVSAVAKVNKTLNATETFDAELVLLDEKNGELSKEFITMSTNNVEVTVPISKKKTVPIIVDYANAPIGFDAKSVSVSYNYPSVNIIGSPDKVDKTSQITLSPIDLSTLTMGKKSFDLSLKLPEGVRLLDSVEYITVTVNAADYAEKTLNVNSVKYIGLSTGLSTGSMSAIKNVKVCGPSSVINNITSEDISAEVDLTDKKAGQHTVPVKFKLGKYKNVWISGQYNTTVTIK